MAAAEEFAALVRRLHPGVSTAHLERVAGLPRDAIAYYLKPSTNVARLPTATVINDLARALGCDPTEVMQAFAADLGLPFTQELTSSEQDLLRITRQLNDEGQRTLLAIAETFISTHPHT